MARPHPPGRHARRSVVGVLLALLAVLGRASPAPAVEARLGETDLDLRGSLSVWDVIRLHHDTPREDPSTALALALTAAYRERFRLVTRIEGGYDGKVGDPSGSNPILPLDSIYADRDLYLDLDEVYLETFFESFELRVGKQKVSWGQLDEIQPTDHLNPEDLTEFFFQPELERKIGVPGIRLLGFRGPWTLDAVWNPVYTAYRFPNEDDRWFPPLLEVPDAVDTPLGAVPTRARYRDVDRPAHTLAHSDVGLRVTRFWRGAEASLALFHGFDKSATFGARATAAVTPTGDPQAPAAVRADVDVFPTLHRITALGFDLAVPVWLLALRAEGAWIHGRFFPTLLQDELTADPAALAAIEGAVMRVAASGVGERVDVPLGPTELERESLQYGIGIDLFMSDLMSQRLLGTSALAGSFFLLQFLEEVIFDHDARLIADPVEHVLGFTFRQSFDDERLLAELKIAYTPAHGDYYVWPQLTYKVRPRWHVLLGARVLGGSATTRFGQYRDHDGIRLGLRVFL